jgi:phytoene dehydrogenase-like protein
MKKILIIGAGIAGLTAAAYARKNGFEVDVYEMHHLPGGECTGWQRGEYHFDGCIHWMMGTKPGTELNKLWRDVGALDDSIPIHLHEYFFQMERNGRKLIMYRDVNRLEPHLLSLSPQDADLIRKTCQHIRAFTHMEMPLAKPMDMYTAMDGIKMAFRFGKLMPLMNQYQKISVEEFANQFQDELIREALKIVIPPAYSAISILSTLGSLNNGDSGWPMGGSLALSKRMADHLIKAGGRIHYHAPVERILIEEGRAVGLRLKNGEEVLGDYVISAADGYHTLYQLLEGKYISEPYKKMYTDSETYQLDCSVLVYLGVKADLSAKPQTYITELKEPLLVADQPQNTLMIKHFCYDPAMAKDGKSVICVVFNTDYEWWQQKHADPAGYKNAKAELAETVKAAVEKVYPEISGNVEIMDVATPMTYVRYCNAWKGAYMSFITKPGLQPTYYPGNLPGLDNFYMAGMWTQFPGGLPGASMAGKFVIQRICGLEKIQFRVGK